MICPECGTETSLVREMLGGWAQVRCLRHGKMMLKGPTGPELRDAGVDEVEELPADAPWRVVARDTLERLASSGRSFTAEDVTAVAGMPAHPNSIGALFGGASRRGIIEPVGWSQAERAARHANMNRVWRGKQ